MVYDAPDTPAYPRDTLGRRHGHYVSPSGNESWFVHGERHRLDGPAVEWRDGGTSWYINGDLYTNFKDFQEAGNLSDDQMTILCLKYGSLR